MNIKKAIQRYEQNMRLAMDGEKDFSFITCRQKCGCLVGIRFDDVARWNMASLDASATDTDSRLPWTSATAWNSCTTRL